MASQAPIYGLVQQNQSGGIGGHSCWTGNGGQDSHRGTGTVGVVRGDGDVKPGYPAGPPPAAQETGQTGTSS